MHRGRLLAMLGLPLVLIGGCPLLDPPDLCAGKACDYERWVVLFAKPGRFDVLPPWSLGCASHFYDVEFVPLGDRLLAAASLRTQDLRVAVARRDGTLIVTQFGAEAAEVELPLGVVGVAWSWSGDRLAIVTRALDLGPADAHTLEILTPDLMPIASYSLDLPVPNADSSVHRFIVSWNADDSLVAVSTDLGVFDELPNDAGIRNVRNTARCIALDPDSGARATYPISNVYFIGTERVVATWPVSETTFTSRRRPARLHAHRSRRTATRSETDSGCPLSHGQLRT